MFAAVLVLNFSKKYFFCVQNMLSTTFGGRLHVAFIIMMRSKTPLLLSRFDRQHAEGLVRCHYLPPVHFNLANKKLASVGPFMIRRFLSGRGHDHFLISRWYKKVNSRSFLVHSDHFSAFANLFWASTAPQASVLHGLQGL